MISLKKPCKRPGNQRMSLEICNFFSVRNFWEFLSLSHMRPNWWSSLMPNLGLTIESLQNMTFAILKTIWNHFEKVQTPERLVERPFVDCSFQLHQCRPSKISTSKPHIPMNSRLGKLGLHNLHTKQFPWVFQNACFVFLNINIYISKLLKASQQLGSPHEHCINVPRVGCPWSFVNIAPFRRCKLLKFSIQNTKKKWTSFSSAMCWANNGSGSSFPSPS